MRFFTFLPVVFCLGVQALPAAQRRPGDQITDVRPPHSTVEKVPAPTPPHLTPLNHLEKREQIDATIEQELDKLGLNLDSEVKKLLDKLGLKAVHDSMDKLLSGLTGEVDAVHSKVNEIVSRVVVSDLGLEGGLDETICDCEKKLGLNHQNTVRNLLVSLHLM